MVSLADNRRRVNQREKKAMMMSLPEKILDLFVIHHSLSKVIVDAHIGTANTEPKLLALCLCHQSCFRPRDVGIKQKEVAVQSAMEGGGWAALVVLA